jgi:hypothetical protein
MKTVSIVVFIQFDSFAVGKGELRFCNSTCDSATSGTIVCVLGDLKEIFLLFSIKDILAKS